MLYCLLGSETSWSSWKWTTLLWRILPTIGWTLQCWPSSARISTTSVWAQSSLICQTRPSLISSMSPRPSPLPVPFASLAFLACFSKATLSALQRFLFFPFLLFVQVLSHLLISTPSLTHLTIFHKLTSIQQNRIPSQVWIQSNFVQRKCLGIAHWWEFGSSSENEPSDQSFKLAGHHNGSQSPNGAPALDWEESLPHCSQLPKVGKGWQPPKVNIIKIDWHHRTGFVSAGGWYKTSIWLWKN